jgi:hypothetical protein
MRFANDWKLGCALLQKNFEVNNIVSIGFYAILRKQNRNLIWFDALQSAIYKCPQLKLALWYPILHTFSDCPQDLFEIVMAKANCIGNCCLVEWNGNSIEEGAKEILGINACLLVCRPKNNQASKT